MFAAMMLVLGCVVVAVLVLINFKAEHIPPKAKLLCEVWRLVEGKKRSAFQAGRSHIYGEENDQSEKRYLQKMY